jgi:hypothetical protein
MGLQIASFATDASASERSIKGTHAILILTVVHPSVCLSVCDVAELCETVRDSALATIGS